ncbi:MAG: GNAT family N-acetyltransferase [Bacteroidia bacterium]|nr:GNAT family N-acetyltransferase [Bacteroidia bacterium]
MPQVNFDKQPVLQNDIVKAFPLQANDFEILYSLAADPLVWEQHPNKNRYKREVFEVFFKGALESGGALMVYDAKKGRPIGTSRFYDYDPNTNTVAIGYTFFDRAHWGGLYNPALKKLMLSHAFQFVDRVEFHIGAGNIRSQKAIEKLGAKKIDQKEVSYYGEDEKLNFIYCIERAAWEHTSSH